MISLTDREILNGPGSPHMNEDQVEAAEVELVARGIATAVAPEDGITAVQAQLLEAIATALTGVEVDYTSLEPLSAEALAAVLADRPQWYRQRIVHHMVLGELVLGRIPHEVAWRVQTYASALGVDDKFVRVARRFAQGAHGLAWMDLQRSGFVEHVRDAATDQPTIMGSSPFEPAQVDPELEQRWRAFADLPESTLGRGVWELYDGRGFALPGSPGGAPVYLAQHDFVHVLADYGTNLKGELEVFAFIGRADPDPKGFAWLATLVGLFETGYVKNTGFFERNWREHNIQAPGMQYRIADAIRRGKVVSESCGMDLFTLDYHALAATPIEDVRSKLHFPEKSVAAREGGSAGAFDLEGMSEIQRRAWEQRHAGEQGDAS